MIHRAEFDQLVRDALANLYDFAMLETHPLAALLSKPRGQLESRADRLREHLLHAIERLRPPSRERSANSVEWRPYLILHGRYVEGISLRELQVRLGLSERQLRREHSRALQAVATLLWDQALLEPMLPQAPAGERIGDQQWGNNITAFQPTLEPLDPVEVIQSVARTLQRRLQSEGAELYLVLPQALPLVLADRVIFRQIFFSLLDWALDVRSEGTIAISAEVQVDHVSLKIQFRMNDRLALTDELENDTLEAARYWAQRLDATLQQTLDREAGFARLVLALPRADQMIVLVVDDQEPAVRMFRRFLSYTNLRVVGVQEGVKVLPMARRLHPQAITLDVMMPTIDGWEILQALQADPETRHIPVIICSVWNEPELASSLGAAAFLKKPITQKDLLDALARLGLVGIPAGSSREDFPRQR
uniref:Hybrid sensor histidine kinase/response regulator n=1 Tax=Caldilinea aerophila TaxID=133453 RepID=A0A7C1JZY5_9CHLR